MKKIRNLIKLSAVVIVTLFFSCSDNNEGVTGNEISVVETPPSRSIRSVDDSSSSELPYSDTVILGAKLPNPYTVNIMRVAANSLVDSGMLSEEYANIQPTHYYIRLLPLDSVDMEIMYSHPDLILWDYPLDYEVLTSEGSYYRDPDLPEGQPNSQYTVVPVGMILPNVNYEILAELFLEDDEEDENAPPSSGNSISEIDYWRIEREAHAILGAEFDTPSPMLRASKWHPSGQILVKDRSMGGIAVPVPGVEVRARNFLRFRRTHTDKDGNFRTGYFRGKNVGFSIKWEYADERFDIRNGGVVQAFTNGPNQKKTWYKTFDNDEGAFRAHIFRAGWYYLNNSFGFGNKPFNRISVQGRYHDNARDNVNGYYNGFSENINIWGRNKNGNKFPDDSIFAISAHEFAHAHHDEIYDGVWSTALFDDFKSPLAESWANGMRYEIVKLAYSATSISNKYNMQGWSNETGNLEYTPLVIDLIDDHDQSNIIDKVSGFTPKQIADILKKSGTKKLSDLKNELKKLNNAKAPEKYLDILFLEMERGGYNDYLENKMFGFQNKSAWEKATGQFNMNTISSSYLNLKSTGTTNMTITSNYAIVYPNINNWSRVGVRVRLSMPENTPWIPTWYYAGNLQLSISDIKNSWYDWIGQFDINKNGGYVEDGKYFVQYEFILPDYVAQRFKQNDPFLRLMFSANSGAEFNLHKMEFFDADRDNNRVLNLTQQQKDNAVLYSTFIANPYPYLNYASVSPNLIVYKIINGQKHYYRPGQDVDDKMILVERWTINPAYEPGLPSGFWRQCWIYLGKE